MVDKIDLHTHTLASDGSLTPPELVDKAIDAKFCAIAITDHDSVDGVDEAVEHAKGFNINIIPGIEMGAKFDAEMHILGLGIDIKNDRLLSTIHKLRMGRQERNAKMVKKLIESGLPISYDDVYQGKDESTVGRAHMAYALVEKGCASSIPQAFDRYLARGKEGYVKRYQLKVSETLEIINDAGGVSSVAHPVQLNQPIHILYQVFESLKENGLWGIEAYHSTQTPEQSETYCKMAKRLGLKITGGSDFHGLNKPDVKLGDSVVMDDFFMESYYELRDRTIMNW